MILIEFQLPFLPSLNTFFQIFYTFLLLDVFLPDGQDVDCEVERAFLCQHTDESVIQKYYYIVAIIDLYSRKVIAYKVSKHNSTQLVTAAFRAAYNARTPESGLVFHSDRGAQYTSIGFGKLMHSCQVEQSFSKSACPHDNAVMESFFSYLKKEELYRHRYLSEKDFLRGIDRYIAFYNEKRPHGAIHYKTPNAFEEASNNGENA